jgi:hypothetical protein
MSSCSVTGNAQYLTTNTCSVGGTNTSGVTPASPAPLPISDSQIKDWEDIAVAGGVISGNYTVSGSSAVILGPKKIDGTLTVNNGATLTLTGPVWVNGNVNFSNNSNLNVSANTGNSGAIIIADATNDTANTGRIAVSNNTSLQGNGNAGSYPMLLSTNTGNNAISLANNSASVIIYAPYGTVSVSNNAGANEITAKKITLSNNATITYVSGLQSTSFSNGPGGSWTVVPGTYVITE